MNDSLRAEAAATAAAQACIPVRLPYADRPRHRYRPVGGLLRDTSGPHATLLNRAISVSDKLATLGKIRRRRRDKIRTVPNFVGMTLEHRFFRSVIYECEEGDRDMTMRKLLRRRSAIRELLQNLETRPFSEDTPPSAGGWSNQSRPRLDRSSPCAPARSCEGDRR